MTLTFVDPSSATIPGLNLLLYGPPKVGKTVGALSAPGPVLLLNAEGADAALMARQLHPETEIREVSFEGRQTLNEVYQYLRAGNGVKTAVVDSVGEIHRKLLEQLGGDRASLQVHGDVNTIVERFIRSLRDLPINVVLIAHEQIEDAEGDRIVRPRTGGRQLPEMVMAMMSIIGYCAIVPATDEAPQRYVAQLVEAKGRRAGSRFPELGAARDIDISDWLTVIAGVAAAAKDAEKPEPKARSRKRRAANGNGAEPKAETQEQQAELEGAAA